MSKVTQIMDYYAQKITGKLGLGFKNFKTQEEYYINGDERFPAASTFKIPVLIELFNQVHSGKISLTDMIVMQEDDISPGSGVLSALMPGLSMSVRDYAVLMMIVSDNTGTDIIYNLVGRENIAAMIKNMGLKNTRCDMNCKELLFSFKGVPAGSSREQYKKMEEEKSFVTNYALLSDMTDIPNDVSSPADMVKMLSLIYNHELFSPEYCMEMLEIMGLCQTNSRIPFYLPKEGPHAAKVSHKTGTLEVVANDCGIIFTPTQTYALTMYYNGYTASEREKEMPQYKDFLLADISKEIFNALHS